MAETLAEISGVQNPVCDFAEGRGWLVRRIAYRGRRAAVDCMFIKKGRVIFVEFKRPGKEANPQQEREHKRLRKHGAEVFVIDNAEAGYALFA